MDHLGSFPVVETDITARIARHDELAVRTDADIDAVPGAVVAFEDFLSVLSEAVGRGVDNDLVVGRLKCD